ncbi:MAG: hypothetical protein KJP04_07010 [Arenicella sp.]|nr:hypothetical protein [Arenicella sp.]
MTKEKLVNQHILEYKSRLKHIEELFERANKATDNAESDSAEKAQLDEFAEAKARLEDELEEIKDMDVEHWREETISQSGPMAIWDILAQKLEDFLEHHEQGTDSETKG